MNVKILAAILIGILVFLVLVVRLLAPRQMDDVYPGRYCEEKYVRKSDILMVVPLPGKVSIAQNATWCARMQSLNKTIGMHGVQHTRGEFAVARDREYMQRGMEEFKQCFERYPTLFEAPELRLSKENAREIRELNMTITRRYHLLFRKTYHCTDPEKTSWLVKLNALNEII